MKARTLARHVREGAKNLGRNGLMTFASISAVTVMLLVVGAFLTIILNINYFTNELENDVEVRVFIDLLASEEEQDELYSNIESLNTVDSVDFVPRDEGLDDLIESLGEEGEVFESLREENPLNDVFVVQANDPHQTEQVAQQIESFDHVEMLDYGQDIVEQLFSFTNLTRIIGIALIVGLMFTAMFLIANTIKLTIIARKTEIQIMKLVGATNGFIRWPFFIEGLLLGVFGSLIPIVALVYGYEQIYQYITVSVDLSFIEMLPPYPLILQVSLIIISIGAFVGVWGSLMSVRKFLKV
ncbi:permease-like cell division protein FtsX [Texcoconibacillus texcoconensis]|uniref:Cell division protein FtsX n=1 Tax=Texcoconibacillus texcoconensis TaxID=1095777 RepID=A0A840QPT2_9BACI|nr:permease-like cell division protein FtsX [Texcoconibacillus texcoconensis]MBB5173426.1 cell division transport system permease protein [Texcoconibacillus texcoconensis]